MPAEDPVEGRDAQLPRTGSDLSGTDLATFYRPAGTTTWQVLSNNLPSTAVMQLSLGASVDPG